MTTTHTRSASGRCRKTPAAGGAQGFVTFPCLPALSASRAEPAPRPAPAGRAFLRHRSSMAERPAHNGLVAGSIPAGATIEPLSGETWNGVAIAARDERTGPSPVATSHPSAVWHVRYRCGARSSGRLTLAGTAALTRHGNASNRRQYARAGLHLSPLSGGVPRVLCEGQSGDGLPRPTSTAAHHPSADTQARVAEWTDAAAQRRGREAFRVRAPARACRAHSLHLSAGVA